MGPYPTSQEALQTNDDGNAARNARDGKGSDEVH